MPTLVGLAVPQVLAHLAKGRLRDKREQLLQALDGRIRSSHRLILALIARSD
jgi:hypothetical protein